MPVTSDAQRALALLERVQRRATGDISGTSAQLGGDLELLTGLLSSPVLKKILTIQDSLTELQTLFNQHPSLLPTDFDIDTGGKLVVSPAVLQDAVHVKSTFKEGVKETVQLLERANEHQADLPTKPQLSLEQVVRAAGENREIITIPLNKPEGQSLGFSVVGLSSDHKGNLGIFIQEIQPHGIAGRDGHLREGDQILAIDGQLLDAAVSHQEAISILQRAHGRVEFVVARGTNPEFQFPATTAATAAAVVTPPGVRHQQQQHSRSNSQLVDLNSTRSSSPESEESSPSPSPPVVAPVLSVPSELLTASVGRSSSALSSESKPGSDMVLNTEWAQVEIIDLINDGSGLGFGIIGGRSTGVVVKTIVPGGVSDRDGRLQSGDHILQIGEVSLRGMGSEQVAAVLRQCGTQVRLVVARPIEPTSPHLQSLSNQAPIVPTKVLNNPEEFEKHLALLQNGFLAETYEMAPVDGIADVSAAAADEFGDRFIFSTHTLDLQEAQVQLHSQTLATDSEAAMVTLSGTHLTSSTTDGTLASADLLGLTVGQVINVEVNLESDVAARFLPEVETFDVELIKDNQGLGITIAGYVCEKEELSGIFVKSINPGSVADLCGNIQVNDQIVEVDGQSLRGFSNQQAVEVLRSTGQVVHLRLARYLRGPKYEQLLLAMAESAAAPPVQSSCSSTDSSNDAPPSSPSPAADVPVVMPQVPQTVDMPDVLDLDQIDPDAEVGVQDTLDLSGLSLEELETLIDQTYSGSISPVTEAALVAKWNKILEGDVDIVVAQMSKFQPAGGLGISLEGTVDVEEGREVRPHHYIRSILPDGPIGLNGKLRSGDELLEVNGRKLLGLNHVEVVGILKDLPQNVRMVCARRNLIATIPSRPIDPSQDRAAFAARNILGGSLQSLIPSSERLVKAKSDGSLASNSADSSFTKNRSRSLEPLTGLATWSSEPQVIELHKGDRGLGFSILDYQDPMNPNETIIVIRSLVPGGVAQQDGRLIPGDRLLFVNDTNVEHASLDEAVQALKGASKGLVRIGVAKPHPVIFDEANESQVQEQYSESSDEERSSESSDESPPEEMDVLPPPLPETGPPDLEEDQLTNSQGSELSNPLLVPVATERLLGFSSETCPADSVQLPSALERTVRIKKGSDPLGINVEVVDGGVNGVLVTSVTRAGAVQRDGTIRPGDYILSVNNETMRFATSSQARAILRRTQLVSTDVSIVYTPAMDAAIYRQSALIRMTEDVNNQNITTKSSSTSVQPCQSGEVEQPFNVDEHDAAVGERPVETSSPLVEETQATVIFTSVEEAKEPLESQTSNTTIAQVPSAASAMVKMAGASSTHNGNVSAIWSRHWGPERAVRIVRDPTKSLGISIVGGKVDVTSGGGGTPITGIFIKNVLPDSPAGRTGQLRTGDRILEVDGVDLREASHERAVEVIRKAGDPVVFLVQSLIDLDRDSTPPPPAVPANPAAALQVPGARDLAPTPSTDVDCLTPVPNGAMTPVEMNEEPESVTLSRVAPPPISPLPARTPTPEVIQSGIVKSTPPAPVTRTESSESEEDERDLQGRILSAKGIEIDRASAGAVKLKSRAQAAEEPDEAEEEENDFGYTNRKIQKRWGDLSGEIVRVDLDRSAVSGSTASGSLGISLAGHRDRTKMAVLVCGLHPSGVAYKDGRLQIGDEILEVNGHVLYGRCHLNASAIIKSAVAGHVSIIVLRREGALQEMAVPPITRFPVSLDDQSPEERYARFKNPRVITLKKGPQGLGIMIIEGRHAEVGNGIFISDIQEGSVAEQAGLSVGDLILCVNKDELLNADYETAASVLKKAEGLLTIVVCNPSKASPAAAAATGADKASAAKPEAAKEVEKPKLPPKPTLPPKPSHSSGHRLFTKDTSVSSSSLPTSASLSDSPRVQRETMSQSAPQSPFSSSSMLNQSLAAQSETRANHPSPRTSELESSQDPVAPVTTSAPPTDPAPLPSKDQTTNPPKAVLRQHGGRSKHGNPSSSGSLTVKTSDEPAPDPATCEVKPGTETTIEINKDKLGLGLSIVGGSDTLLGAILIHEVYPDGAAARDGRLKPGDQILEVNGESFRNITHSRALAVLRQTPAKVKMMVYRDETSLKDDDMLDIIEVELLKKPGRGLGLSIVGRRNGPGVYISDVVKGGAAEADGRLMQGDQILSVNGNDLRTASQEQAAAILKTAMGKIDLKVGRLKAGAASPRSANSAESSPASSHPETSMDSTPSAISLPSHIDTPPSLGIGAQSGSGSDIVIPSYRTVVLERGPDGLGFSIVGGKGNPQGDLPIFVKTVFERGAAADSGLLRPGDQIVAVDSVPLDGMTHHEAVALLKNAKGSVTLMILS